MTQPEERLYHARWSLQHLTAAAGELQQAIDHLEHALLGTGNDQTDHPTLAALRASIASANVSAAGLRSLIKGALATAARASLAQTAPARNACCGNPGIVWEGGRQHCATCGQAIP